MTKIFFQKIAVTVCIILCAVMVTSCSLTAGKGASGQETSGAEEFGKETPATETGIAPEATAPAEPASDDDGRLEQTALPEEEREKLMQKIELAMPEAVTEEINKKGHFYTLEDAPGMVLVGNDREEPSLRLDFDFEENTLISYVSKEYGFVDSMTVKEEKTPEEVIETFAKVFLDKLVTLKKVKNASHYSGEDVFSTYQDQDHARYVLQNGKNMVVNYSNE